MQLSFQNLSTYLAPGAIELVGNTVKINCSVIAEENINLNSSAIKTLTRLLHGFANLTDAINEHRQSQYQPPIEFVEQQIYGSGQSQNLFAESVFTLRLKVKDSAFIDEVIDPTENS